MRSRAARGCTGGGGANKGWGAVWGRQADGVGARQWGAEEGRGEEQGKEGRGGRKGETHKGRGAARDAQGEGGRPCLEHLRNRRRLTSHAGRGHAGTACDLERLLSLTRRGSPGRRRRHRSPGTVTRSWRP